MQMAMRAVFVVIMGSILSILVIKYAENDLDTAVPMLDPAAVSQPT